MGLIYFFPYLIWKWSEFGSEGTYVTQVLSQSDIPFHSIFILRCQSFLRLSGGGDQISAEVCGLSVGGLEMLQNSQML